MGPTEALSRTQLLISAPEQMSLSAYQGNDQHGQQNQSPSRILEASFRTLTERDTSFTLHITLIKSVSKDIYNANKKFVLK